MTEQDNGNGKKPSLEIANHPTEVVLDITFTVVSGDPDIMVTFEPLGKPQHLSADAISRIFENAGSTLMPGIYIVRMQFEDMNCAHQVLSMPEGLAEHFGTEVAPAIFGSESELGRLCIHWHKCLFEGHKSFPHDEGDFETLARVAVDAAVLSAADANGPLRELLELPTIEELTVMTVVGACAHCGFVERRGLLEELFGGGTPKQARGVITHGDVKVRVVHEDGELVAMLGYLEHENPFEDLFHNELIIRVAPLIRAAAGDQLRRIATALEMNRRADNRLLIAMFSTYPTLTSNEVQNMADGLEEQARERAKFERELEKEGERFGMPGMIQIFGV